MKHYEGDDRVAFIAVQTAFEGFASNGPDQARQTAERYGLTIPVGHSGSANERSTVMERYRTAGTPWTAIIDPEGIVQFNGFQITSDDAEKLIDRMLNSKSNSK